MHLTVRFQDVIEDHQKIWSALTTFLDCDGQGAGDPVANLLVCLVMLFIVNKEEESRLENPERVWRARRRREDMLGRYLSFTHGAEIAREKLSVLGDFVGTAKAFYAMHKHRVFNVGVEHRG